MEKEAIIIEKTKKQNLGKWIAIKDKKTISTSESFNEVMKKLKEKNIVGAYVFYSPRPEEKKYGYLFVLVI